jgi:hypothetical protein
VKLQGRAAGKLSSPDNVRVNADVTDAALHVAGTGLADDPGNINTISGGVTGLETLFVGLGVHKTIFDYNYVS